MQQAHAYKTTPAGWMAMNVYSESSCIFVYVANIFLSVLMLWLVLDGSSCDIQYEGKINCKLVVHEFWDHLQLNQTRLGHCFEHRRFAWIMRELCWKHPPSLDVEFPMKIPCSKLGLSVSFGFCWLVVSKISHLFSSEYRCHLFSSEYRSVFIWSTTLLIFFFFFWFPEKTQSTPFERSSIEYQSS